MALPLGLSAGLGLAAGALGKGKSDPPPIAPLNPNFGILLDLFGSTFLNGRNFRGVFNDPSNEGVFGGNDFQEAIRNLTFGAPGLTGAEQGLGADFLNGNDPFNQLRTAQTQLAELVGLSQDQARTGFQTSAQPSFEEAIRQLKQNIFPQLAETAGVNTGISSSSFLESGNRAASDLLGQSALRQIGLNESAANRRAAALPILGQLIGTQLGLQPAFVNDLQALSGGLRSVTNAQQRRPLDVFSALSGLTGPNNQGFLVSGQNPQGSGLSSLVSGLSSAIPSLIASGGNPAAAGASLGLSALTSGG